MIRNIDIRDKEISKLIQFGYDLHKKDFKRYHSDRIPVYKFYNGNSCPMKEMDNGGIFGFQSYRSHSDSIVSTLLGVCVGKNNKEKFKFEYAFLMETNDDGFYVHCENLKETKEEDGRYKTLDYTIKNSWNHMSDEEKINRFVQAMEFIGFKKQDVLDVINGKMTARQAFMNVAPEEIKNKQWVSLYRRYFVFDGNVAIEGNFSSIDLDYFPFPFDEQPILDCSKVNTCCVHFDENKHRVKLINVNKNINSIKYTDITNAIIDEAIDLSLVDANGTKFGNHKVINIENSISKITDMDLSLAVNENGERFVINKDGVVELYDNRMPKMISSLEKSNDNYSIEFFANADDYNMAKDALINEADGIGLVRTEYIFKDTEDLKKMLNFVINYPQGKEEILSKLKELQKKQVQEILSTFTDKKVVFRLMDFKTAEFLTQTDFKCDEEEYYINALRGAALLETRGEILNAQLEAIFEVMSGKNCEVNLLIPLLEDMTGFEIIKRRIVMKSEEYNIKNLKVGAMIENTKMAYEVDELVKEADFISIGTNDLTQSVTGLSRNDNSIEFQILTDDVKREIKNIVSRARKGNECILIGVCGEHSNYIENMEFYNDLNINYITCDSNFIAPNKEFKSSIKKANLGSSKVFKRTIAKKDKK